MNIDRETTDWIEKNKDLIAWLRTACEKIEFGSMSVRFHEGEIVGCDLRPRIRVKKYSKPKKRR